MPSLVSLLLAVALLDTPVAFDGAAPLPDTVPAAEADVLVFAPELFDRPLETWIAHRREQGHRIAVLRPGSMLQMRDAIRTAAASGKLKSVLLIGDAPDRNHPGNVPFAPHETPTAYIPAEIDVRFGSEPWIATDHPLVDLDDDTLPDLAIGRIAVADAQGLETVVDKVIRYETRQPHTAWKRRINLVAGVGGFGAVADSVLELSTKQFVVKGIPSCYDASMTYGSWQSAYCPPPPRFGSAAIDRFNDGCLFWIYIGHGSPGSVAPVETPTGRYRVLDSDDASRLASREGLPIAIFLACYTAAYDYNSRGPCLAEAMLERPDGPVAVLGASRVSMPYAMAVMSHELMEEYFAERHATLGELVQHAKRRSIQGNGDPDDGQRALLDGLAGVFSPTRDELDAERTENLYLFNLIGDPLLRLSYPRPIELERPERVQSGDVLTVRGSSPIAGMLSLDLSYRRDRLTFDFAGRAAFDESDPSLDEFDATYRRANDRTLQVVERPIEAGPFEVTITVPEWARGAAVIRAFVAGEQEAALGSVDLTIRKPR